MAKRILRCLICALMVIGLAKMSVSAIDGTATGTQKAYVIVDDWGAGVSKSIITLDKVINADSVSKDDFIVWQTAGTTVSQRTILDAYASDSNGNKIEADSNIVTIEMKISPTEGSPFSWSTQTWRNTWANPYESDVTLADNQTLHQKLM